MGHLGCPRCAKTMKDDGTPCPACGFEMPAKTDGASLRARVAHAVSVGFAPQWICTSCGTPGNPVTHTKGSFGIEIILWLMMILPGLLYSVWRLSSRAKVCPSCRQPSMIPIDSPVAKTLRANIGVTLALAMLGAAAAHALPQVTARQGPTNDERRFRSPMVIETALPVSPGFLRTQFGKEIADYTCDDVSLQELSYQVTDNKKHPDRPTWLSFDGFVVVPNSFDREVDVLVTVKQGGETIGSRGKFKISAEEGRRTRFNVRVPVIRLHRVTDSAAPPVVEFTLTVRDNS